MKPNQLGKLQNDLQNWVYVPDEEADLIDAIKAPLQGNVHERLMIYHQAYFSRLIDIVVEDYPKLHALLGDDNMHTCITDYVHETKAQHFSVRYYGQYLSDFLKTHSSYRDYPILAEMAQFEWALNNMIDAKGHLNDARATLQDLKLISPDVWPNLQVDFHPSIECFLVHHDITSLWQQLDDNEKQGIEKEVLPPQSPTTQACFVWQHELKPYFVASNEPLDLTVFELFQNGETFAAICEVLQEYKAVDQIAPYLAGLLQYWLQQSLIVKIKI